MCYECAHGSVNDRDKWHAIKSLLLSDARPGRSIPYILTWCQLILAPVFYTQNCHKSLHHLRLASLVPLWIFSGHDGQWNTSTVPSTLVSYSVCVCVCFIYTFNTQHHAGSHAIIQPEVCSRHLRSALHKLWKYSASMWGVLILLVIIGTIWGTAVAQAVAAQRYMPKGVDSIPEEVTEIFHWLAPSGRSMALGSNQPLTLRLLMSYIWSS